MFISPSVFCFLYLVNLLVLLTTGSCKQKNTPPISIDSDAAALKL